MKFTSSLVAEINDLAGEVFGAGTKKYASQNLSAPQLEYLRDRASLSKEFTELLIRSRGLPRRHSYHEQDRVSALRATELLGLVDVDPLDELAAARAMSNQARSLGDAQSAAFNIMTGDDAAVTSVRLDWAWAKFGFQTITIPDEKYAASIMCTKVPKELSSLVLPPWPAFRLAIPAGLVWLEDDGGQKDPVGRVVVGVRKASNGSLTWTIMAYGEVVMANLNNIPTDELCEEVEEESVMPSVFNMTDSDRAALRMVCRLALGACMAFDSSKHRPSMSRSDRDRRSHGPEMPNVPRYVLGKNIVLEHDARPFVADYMRSQSKRGPLTVRQWVPGHWKNQPCGPGSKERRLIQIEPYPRGPKGGSVPLRAHVLKG